MDCPLQHICLYDLFYLIIMYMRRPHRRGPGIPVGHRAELPEAQAPVGCAHPHGIRQASAACAPFVGLECVVFGIAGDRLHLEAARQGDPRGVAHEGWPCDEPPAGGVHLVLALQGEPPHAGRLHDVGLVRASP